MVAKPMFGEPAPKFVAPTPSNPKFHFDTVAGRGVVLLFVGHPITERSAQLVAEAKALRAQFDDRLASLFYVISEPEDVAKLGIEQALPGVRYFMDYDRTVALAYGYAQPPQPDAETAPGAPVECGFVALDRALRGLQSVVATEAKPYLAPVMEGIRRLEQFQRTQGSLGGAPVIVLERIFEPQFCRALIDFYKRKGGEDSGFMRDKEGVTVGVIDHSFKRRADAYIDDDRLVQGAMRRIQRRLVPMIHRCFQFEVTRIERHIVACYDSSSGGFFRPHRDNTTKGTAHRRFAVTINLNAEEYEGGELRIPEFGDRSYRAPTGGAVVFSCSLLHEALPVTAGVRYAYLPFLYNDADADLRERNKQFLDKKSGGHVDYDSMQQKNEPSDLQAAE